MGSVAVYGAAALMPLWLPIVLGKRRRRRDLQLEDDLQDVLEAVRMIHSPPPVTRSLDFSNSEESEMSLRRRVRAAGAEADEEAISVYEQFPSFRHLVEYLKKELKNRAKRREK